MLGDILFGTQLFVTHLGTTFSVGNHYDRHGRYAVLASGGHDLVSARNLS